MKHSIWKKYLIKWAHYFQMEVKTIGQTVGNLYANAHQVKDFIKNFKESMPHSTH